MKKLLLSTAYLAPIQYFSILINYSSLSIEKHENYLKQSYRNRCEIHGANGRLGLTIPVKKNHFIKTQIKDLKIDYDTSWHNIHWKSIVSAYKNSPFFDFYKDELIPFYTQKFTFLLDFNTRLMEIILEHLELSPQISFTEKFYHEYDSRSYEDVRYTFHPKPHFAVPDPSFQPACYTQVFSDKNGFIPNLSIIDLLFNEGPNAMNVLKNSRVEA